MFQFKDAALCPHPIGANSASRFEIFFSILLRSLAFCVILFIGAALMLGSAWGQSAKSAILDETGVQFHFGAASSGKRFVVFAVNLGEVAVLQLDRDGSAYLDLSQIRPPKEKRACFFLINPATREFVSMSSKEGFYNPHWEQREQRAGSGSPPRALSAISAEEADLNRRVASARAWLATHSGERYVNGQCVSPPLVEKLRPAYGFNQPANYFYASVRCAEALGPTPLSCPNLQRIVSGAAANFFASSDCPRGLADAQTVIATGRDPTTKARHEGIGAAAAQQAINGDASQRMAVAAQCIATIAEDSVNQIDAWRNEKGNAERIEEAAMDTCREAVATIADEGIARAELANERKRAQQLAAQPTNLLTSRQARDFACAVR